MAPLLAATLTSDAALSALAFAVAFAAAALFWAAAFPFPFAFFLAAAAAPASAVPFPAAAVLWAAAFPFPFPFAFFFAAASAFAVAFLDLPAMTAFSFATFAEAWASAAVCSHPLALSSLRGENGVSDEGTYGSDGLSGFEFIDGFLSDGCRGLAICPIVGGGVDTLGEYC